MSEALDALRSRVEEIRVLGSYPTATGESADLLARLAGRGGTRRTAAGSRGG